MRSGAIQNSTSLAANVANLPRISKAVPVILPAATQINGQINPTEIALTQAGDRFYVIATSAPIQFQPLRAGNVGATNNFGSGQGQTVNQGFDQLTAKNYNLFPIAALVWIGFEDFINDQLILATNQTPNVRYPTYYVSSTPTPTVNIPDLSGTAFSDVNGKRWYAITRVGIDIFNLDSGNVLLLQKYGATVAGDPAVGAVQPLTPVRFDNSGDFTVIQGGSVNAIISEVYQAIAA